MVDYMKQQVCMKKYSISYTSMPILFNSIQPTSWYFFPTQTEKKITEFIRIYISKIT